MKIHTLDLDFQGTPQAIAAYLVDGPEGWVLIETGPMTTLAMLQKRLAEFNLHAGDIENVLVTHMHLDHAGAAGWWARQGAKIYVHEVGAPHLIDPSKLWSSASRIYGDQMDTLWGEIVPAPAEQVVAIEDEQVIEVGGLAFTALDTPGHAWHHHVFRLGEVAFSGDAAGVRTPGSKWVSLPAPPPEFDWDAWQETLDRLEALRLEALYPTHFGRVDDVRNQLEQVRAMMSAATAFVREMMDSGAERDEVVAEYREWNREQALAAGISEEDYARYELVNPLFMSVDGIMRYWRKRAEKRS